MVDDDRRCRRIEELNARTLLQTDEGKLDAAFTSSTCCRSPSAIAIAIDRDTHWRRHRQARPFPADRAERTALRSVPAHRPRWPTAAFRHPQPAGHRRRSRRTADHRAHPALFSPLSSLEITHRPVQCAASAGERIGVNPVVLRSAVCDRTGDGDHPAWFSLTSAMPMAVSPALLPEVIVELCLH